MENKNGFNNGNIIEVSNFTEEIESLISTEISPFGKLLLQENLLSMWIIANIVRRKHIKDDIYDVNKERLKLSMCTLGPLIDKLEKLYEDDDFYVNSKSVIFFLRNFLKLRNHITHNLLANGYMSVKGLIKDTNNMVNGVIPPLLKELEKSARVSLCK